MKHGLSVALAIVLVVTPVLPDLALAQTVTPAAAPAPPEPAHGDEADTFNTEQLDALLAPIALYPDVLLTQVLMASTFPLDIVQASRWLGDPAHKDLKGDALAGALKEQPWDPSVKSLVPFPQVLALMNDKLDWTQQLGWAASTQQADVLDSVQRLRRQAQAAGNLTSNEQQVVKVNVATVADGTPAPAAVPPVIVIEPANPQVVFVPTYNPVQVFGPWPYPAYPPVYFPPPPGYAIGSALATGLAFGAGVAITASLWNLGRPNWGAGSVNVNVNNYNNLRVNNVNRNTINRNTINGSNINRVNPVGGNGAWRPPPPRGPGGGSGGYRRPDGPVGRPSRPNGLPPNAIGRPNVRVPPDLVRPPPGNRPNLGNGGGQQGPRPPGANRPSVPNRPSGPPTRPPGTGGQAGGSRPNLPARPPAGGGQPGGGNRPNLPARPPQGGGGAGANRPVQRPAERPVQRPAQRPAGAPAFSGAGQGRQAGQFGQRGNESRRIDAAQRRPGGGGGQHGGNRGGGGHAPRRPPPGGGHRN